MLNDNQRQLALRIEEASLNAWPALHQQLYDGWLLRFSRGFTKRANSVNPLYAPAQPPAKQQLLAKIRYCENLYAREDQPSVFRLTTLQGQQLLEELLSARGYTRTGLSLVMACPLPVPGETQGGADDSLLPGMDDWLDSYSTLAQLPPLARSLHQAILRGIHGQLAFARHETARAQPLACGLGVCEAELIGLFDIITAPAARRQGHARRLVLDLLRWGVSCGAQHGYLQVTENNTAAIALYQRLGFRELYRYWYRVSP